MNELVFEVIQKSDGGYVSECLTENIFTQANSWKELQRNARDVENNSLKSYVEIWRSKSSAGRQPLYFGN